MRLIIFNISIINSGNTCLFHKGFCTVFFSENEDDMVILPHSSQQNHAFLVKTEEKSKSQKQMTKQNISLELLHQILVQISIKSLLDGDTGNAWQDIELRADPDPLFTSCKISTINKKVI